MTGLNMTTEPGLPDGAEVEALLDNPFVSAFGMLHEVHFGALALVAKDLEAFGLTISTFEVLLRLARSPGQRLRMAELTAQCNVTSSGLTRVVDRMETANLVVREPCESDRRGYYAVLTPQGLAELMRALPTHMQTLRRIWSVLDDHELEAVVESLRTMRASVAPGSDPAVAALD